MRTLAVLIFILVLHLGLLGAINQAMGWTLACVG